ncbi:unnamed protein product, partial [Ilex paraguariensis]
KEHTSRNFLDFLTPVLIVKPVHTSDSLTLPSDDTPQPNQTEPRLVNIPNDAVKTTIQASVQDDPVQPNLPSQLEIQKSPNIAVNPLADPTKEITLVPVEKRALKRLHISLLGPSVTSERVIPLFHPILKAKGKEILICNSTVDDVNVAVRVKNSK